MDRAVEQLQDEMKVLKNEIKTTLTDIREYLLTYAENPFPVEAPRGEAPRVEEKRVSLDGVMSQPAMPSFLPNMVPQVAFPGAGGGYGFGPPLGAVQSQPGPAYQPPPSPTAAPEPKDGLPVRDVSAQAPGGTGQPAPAEAKADHQAAHHGARPAEAARPKAVSAPGVRAAADRASAPSSPAPELKEDGDEPGPRGKAAPAPGGGGEAPDLIEVAMLVPWVENGINRVGVQRLRAIIEIYASMGGLSSQLKGVLLALLSLDGSAESKGEVRLRDCLRVLAELDDLLLRSRSDRAGAALLSVLLGGSEPRVK